MMGSILASAIAARHVIGLRRNAVLIIADLVYDARVLVVGRIAV